jgi:hypothetical protein
MHTEARPQLRQSARLSTSTAAIAGLLIYHRELDSDGGAERAPRARHRRRPDVARNLDLVVFDKTGTLTLGAHRVAPPRRRASMKARRCGSTPP